MSYRVKREKEKRRQNLSDNAAKNTAVSSVGKKIARSAVCSGQNYVTRAQYISAVSFYARLQDASRVL